VTVISDHHVVCRLYVWLQQPLSELKLPNLSLVVNLPKQLVVNFFVLLRIEICLRFIVFFLFTSMIL